MNIHEFQAKELFAEFGIPVPRGVAVKEAEAFDSALDQLPQGAVVVKAQIHAGGRGKGTFKDGFKGGVHVCPDREAALQTARSMLGNTLVTHQTGPAGKVVKTLYFNEPCSIAREYYLAMTLDRGSSQPVIIASTEGGVDIETVAAETPEKITKVFVDPAQGLQPHHKRAVAFGLGFTEKQQLKEMDQLLSGLYRLYWEKDASLVEVNPLITTGEGRIVALDAKVGFDDNALFRHPEILALRDLDEEDPKEVEASKHGLSYIALDGNIACLVNGAGLAMATMDIIKHDPKVKGILVNIFGGIMSCRIIAKGVIAAARNVDITVPLVVRLEGNEVEEGKALLEQSGLALTPAASLSDAARKVVELVGKAGA